MPAETLLTVPPADLELRRRVEGELAETHRPSLTRLAVDVRQGMIHLSGCVQSFYEKQLAIHSCIRVAGAGHLIDAVEVP